MKIAEAKRILEKPKFGDPLCIEAAECLRDAAKAEALRPKLVGRILDCITCSYRGDKDCPMCKGDGKHTITKQMADDWDLDVLETVLEELNGNI